MSQPDLVSLPDADLRAILLTCDGRGKEAKLDALEILLARAYKEGEDNEWATNDLNGGSGY